MYNPFSLTGKTVLITGASSGIGKAAAVECSRLGAKIILTGRNVQRLNETLASLDGEGHQAIPFDLYESGDIKEFVSTVPCLDGLISNAGTNKICPISFIKEHDLHEIFQVNTLTPILLLKELAKKKKFNIGASVVFTSSMAGLGAVATGIGAYSASKGALSAFVKVAALELASKKVRVNAVCPGMIQTKMIYDESVQDEELKKDMERYPLGRFGAPEDIAWAMVYLLSDASAWVTGTNLVIDGGLTIR